METGQRVAASVWHRPGVAASDKQMLAKRQANAAVALLRMGKPEKVWPLLRHSPDPTVRSYLIHRLSSAGADPGAVVNRLEEEPDLTILRALVLTLGEYGNEALSPEDGSSMAGKLREWYDQATDPGLHAAVEWTLRRWKQDQWLRETDEKRRKDKKRREEDLQRIRRELAASKGQTQPQWYVTSEGQRMIVIPGPVEFLMGSPGGEAEEPDHESLHRTRIGRTYAIAAKPVTVEQYLRFRDDVTIRSSSQSDDCPVTMTNWYQAAEYCNWLSRQEGLPQSQCCYEPNKENKYEEGMKPAADLLNRAGYRLPTEAEWEYACRAGTRTARYYGESEELLPQYAWYQENSHRRSWPVGKLKPNDLGLFDVLGNVSAWCQDRYLPYAMGQGGRAAEDTTDTSPMFDKSVRDALNRYQQRHGAWPLLGESARVLRGGTFYDQPNFVRSAFRNCIQPKNRYYMIGFRPARTYPGRPSTP